MSELQLGDIVIRRHRHLKTQGRVIEVTAETRDGSSLVWVKWAHPTTLPNPSLEVEHTLERVTSQDLPTVDG